MIRVCPICREEMRFQPSGLYACRCYQEGRLHIYYPDRPVIPHDPMPKTEHFEQKRSGRRLAEAGHRRGAPVQQIPHEGKVT